MKKVSCIIGTMCILLLISLVTSNVNKLSAQTLGPSIIEGAKLDVTKATKQNPFIGGTFLPTKPIPCTDKAEFQEEVITGQLIDIDLEKRELSLQLLKGTIFSYAPIWGGVVIIGANRKYQTIDDNLYVSLPICTEAKIELKKLKPSQMVKVTRDGSSAPGAVHSLEILNQGGYWKPAKEGAKYSATFKDSVGNEILGEFGSEVRWEWKEDGTIVITKWDTEATFKFRGDHGQWYYLKNEYIKTHIISLSPGFTGTISGNIKKYEIEMFLSLKDVNWTESVGASGTLPIYSDITGMAGVGVTEDEAKANLSPIQMRKDSSGRNIIYIEQKRPFRGLKVFYFKIKSGSIYLDEETFKKLEGPPLNKERSKILILIDGKKETSVEAVQYHGLVKESVKLPAGIVETEAQLREGLSKSGYKIPNVDFRSNLVLFVLSSEPQCIQIDVDAVSFENGQLTSIIKTEKMRGGAEKDGENAFTLIVIPKSAIE